MRRDLDLVLSSLAGLVARMADAASQSGPRGLARLERAARLGLRTAASMSGELAARLHHNDRVVRLRDFLSDPEARCLAIADLGGRRALRRWERRRARRAIDLWRRTHPQLPRLHSPYDYRPPALPELGLPEVAPARPHRERTAFGPRRDATGWFALAPLPRLPRRSADGPGDDTPPDDPAPLAPALAARRAERRAAAREEATAYALWCERHGRPNPYAGPPISVTPDELRLGLDAHVSEWREVRVAVARSRPRTHPPEVHRPPARRPDAVARRGRWPPVMPTFRNSCAARTPGAAPLVLGGAVPGGAVPA